MEANNNLDVTNVQTQEGEPQGTQQQETPPQEPPKESELLKQNAEMQTELKKQKKMIDQYLRNLGFEKSYIPSGHVGLYERYGYSYVKDIMNYGGQEDHLYEKTLI